MKFFLEIYKNVLWMSTGVLCTLMVLGCMASRQDLGEITGFVSYREKIALPPDAELEISLVDVSIADTAAKVIVQKKSSITTQSPISFVLQYPMKDIQEGMTYSVNVRITQSGRLLFISDRVTPVLTRGKGNRVNLLLVKIP
jgi:putative lipoprotein